MIVSQSYHTRTIAQPSTRTITIQHTTAASLLVELAHPADASLHRALRKAEMRLLTQAWRVDDGVLCITSFSHPGELRYTDGETCDCLARRYCWHRAAFRIVACVRATGTLPVAALPLPAFLEEDDLPSDSFLDGSFDFADDVELTAPKPGPHLLTMAERQAAVDELFAA